MPGKLDTLMERMMVRIDLCIAHIEGRQDDFERLAHRLVELGGEMPEVEHKKPSIMDITRSMCGG